jgi:hypothetical protein
LKGDYKMGKKLVMWESDYKDPYIGNRIGKLLEPDKIFQAVSTFEFDFLIFPGIPGSKANEYETPKHIIDADGDQIEINNADHEDIAIFLESLVGVEPEWSYNRATNDYVEVEDVLCFDWADKVFFSLKDCEMISAYSYVKNSNWTTITLGECDTSYELEVIGECNLDIWDGSNHYYPYNSTGHHALLQAVLIDNSQRGILWHEWSQWQGSELDLGYFVTVEEAKEALVNHPELEEIEEWLNRMGEWINRTQ